MTLASFATVHFTDTHTHTHTHRQTDRQTDRQMVGDRSSPLALTLNQSINQKFFNVA